MKCFPLSTAPQHLKPYLDCVDGAVATGGRLADAKMVDGRVAGRQTMARYDLFRAGQRVASIEIEL
jgi:hypothetical protein